MVHLPPIISTDVAGWLRGLMSDLAGTTEGVAELLDGLRDVQSGRSDEWSMGYNAYSVEISKQGVRISFDVICCSEEIPHEVLVSALVGHQQIEPMR